jgi:hypothetical protein
MSEYSIISAYLHWLKFETHAPLCVGSLTHFRNALLVCTAT